MASGKGFCLLVYEQLRIAHDLGNLEFGRTRRTRPFTARLVTCLVAE